GFGDLDHKMKLIRDRLGDRVTEIAPVIEAFAMAEYRFDRSSFVIKKPVKVIGIDPATRAATSDFASWLKSAENKKDPGGCFELRGEALRNHQLFYQRSWETRLNLPPGMMPPQREAKPGPSSEIIQTQGQLPAAPPLPSQGPELPKAKPMGVVVG